MIDTPATPVAETGDPSDTLEQQARDMLYRMGFESAHELTSGDVVELANLLNEVFRLRTLTESSGTSEDLDDAISLIGSLVERNTEKGEYWQGEDAGDPKLYAADLWQIILNRLRAPDLLEENARLIKALVEMSELQDRTMQLGIEANARSVELLDQVAAGSRRRISRSVRT